MDEAKNIIAIKDFFNIIPPANNCSSVKTCTCNVVYTTDASDYDLKKELPIDINISNADYCYVYIHGIDEEKYHTQFQSNFQDFSFDKVLDCLTIIGNAKNKKFSKYKIKISICQNKINQMIDEETKKTASELVNAIKENFDKLELREISEKYETEIEAEYGLGQNKENGYIGRFFDAPDGSLSIWIGYDPNYGFSISFSSEKKSKQQLENALKIYNPHEMTDNDSYPWFEIRLINIINNNYGNIQVGEQNNIQETKTNTSTESKLRILEMIAGAITIIASVLKALGL